MSDEKMPPCPCCGKSVDTSSAPKMMYCMCGYRCHKKKHVEIYAALAYYHEHKDRRCWNCKSNSGYGCPIEIDHDNYGTGKIKNGQFYCANWEAKK